MAAREGTPRPKARSSKKRRKGRSSSSTQHCVDFTPPTRDWLDFLASLLVRTAREQHATRVVGVDPVRDRPTS
jgi:hypothetical protein